jgi:CDP-paratose 2-epimerase
VEDPGEKTSVRILITGICGFVGSTLAKALLVHRSDLEIFGIDNFIRPGSESNRSTLKALGIKILHGDIRSASDLEGIPKVDAIIDAAANPSVLAGVDGKTSSRQLIEHNLLGTINLLELCKARQSAFVLLSTSRVYSIAPLAALPVEVRNHAYTPKISGLQSPVSGLSPRGVSEEFSTQPPVSLYGSTKLASEMLALEYGKSFGFQVFINRCGVMAGAGQFGRPDQGIFAYWINSHLHRRPLSYIGFDGQGHQVRDCLHPRDLVPLLLEQILSQRKFSTYERMINLSGGAESAMSLRQLTAWCADRFGRHEVTSKPENRPFDIPWIVLDPAKAKTLWNWQPATTRNQILEEIALHAEKHPDWLEISAPL